MAKKKKPKYQRVYHFVNHCYGLDDLARKHIKISRFRDLNDPGELQGAVLQGPELTQLLQEAILEIFEERCGLLCFSKQWDVPTLWSHYADRHSGICLVMDIGTQHELIDVEYKEQPTPNRLYLDYPQFREELESLAHVSPPRQYSAAFFSKCQDFVKQLLRTKHVAWKNEVEVRAITTLTDLENGLYFKSLCEDNTYLREVIIGVRSSLRIEEVQRFVSDYPSRVSVFKASMRKNSFALELVS